jgi:chromosome segregation ATPase
VKELSVDHSNPTLLQAGSQTAISDRMRELLARAAQDHVYEQRTQGAVLDEIRQRLEGMEWLLREVRERELGGLSGALEGVSGRLGELATRPPAWAEGLAQHVEVVRDRVDGVSNRIAGIGDRIESVGDRVKHVAELPSLWTDLGTVREGVAESLKRIQAVLDAAQRDPERTAELTRRLGQLNSSMEAAGGRFTRIDKALSDLTQRTERLEGGVLDLSEGLEDTVTSAIERLTGGVEQLAGKVDGIISRVDVMTAKLADAETRLDTRLAGLDGRLAGFEGRLDGVDGHLTGHATRFDGLDTRLGAVEGRFDGVDGHLTGFATRFDGVDSHLGAVEGRLETVDVRLQSVDGRIETADSRLTGVDDRLTGLDGRLTDVDGRLHGHGQRFDAIEGGFEGVNERLEMVDDRVEAVNQRVGQLPALLEVGEVHKRVGDLISAQGDDQGRRFDTLDERLAEAAAAMPPLGELVELVRRRPDRDQLSETVGEIIQPTHNDLTRRLGALEETMLALAEALLRPSRTGKD